MFIDVDVNSSANLGESLLIRRNEKLYKVMKSIAEIDLNCSDNIIDAFGDAYEYLMRMYAGSAGKSDGEFFYHARGKISTAPKPKLKCFLGAQDFAL